ncbi:MAG: hypothetical protein LBR08_11620 [Bacteroidales bacterium]|jgi:TPR repeat protein|nr:hypothetical protein [Bacteroidales bacterium]
MTEQEKFSLCLQDTEQGDVETLRKLGWMYYDGESVAKDEGKAVEWFRKAPEQGHAIAPKRQFAEQNERSSKIDL